MSSKALREAIVRLMSQGIPMATTVKCGSRYPEVEKVSEIAEALNVETLRNNRDEVPPRVAFYRRQLDRP